jgi:hypothetical protein
MTFRRARARRVFVYACRSTVAFLCSFLVGVVVSPIGFSIDGIGHGTVTDGGGSFFFHSYTSTYFFQVWFSCSGYQSAAKANEVFAEGVRAAVKVIEIGPKHNRDGRLIGQRAVAVLLTTDPNQQYASVFWTDGRLLCSIDSRSGIHAIQFERYRVQSLVGGAR